MTKEEAIWWVNHLFEIRKEEYFNKGMMKDAKEVEEAQAMVLEALSAEAVQQSEQYMKGVEDTKRAFLLAYARESLNMRKRNAQLEVMLNAYRAISPEAVEIVPCKDCKWEFICRQTVEQANTDDVEHRPLEWCSYGERKGGDDE